MVTELGNIFEGQSVIELGAGKGCYSDELRRSARLRPGATVRAFDGAPNVANMTGGLVKRADLTAPLDVPPAAWVLCLETAEHIPRTHESQLLANMHGLNTVCYMHGSHEHAHAHGADVIACSHMACAHLACTSA